MISFNINVKIKLKCFIWKIYQYLMNLLVQIFFLKAKKIIRLVKKKRFINKNKIKFDAIIFKNFTIKIAENNLELKKLNHYDTKSSLKKKIKKKFKVFISKRL